MSMSPSEAELDQIARLASGLDVLDLGTGEGASARAMAATARSVTTVENDPAWQGKADLPETVTRFHGDWRDVPGDFDLVFIDHFPLPDRIQAMAAFASRGAKVVVHDTDLLLRAHPLLRVYLRQFDRLDGEHGMHLIERAAA
jgi:predicted O-methyltransferase YrrM